MGKAAAKVEKNIAAKKYQSGSQAGTTDGRPGRHGVNGSRIVNETANSLQGEFVKFFTKSGKESSSDL
jgi:hypothetical protein